MFKRLEILWNHPHVKNARAEFKKYLQSIQTALNENLFVASPDFWSYHIGGLIVILALDIAFNSIFKPGYIWGFAALSTAIWGIGFFVTGLVFRSHYKSANWEAQSQLTVLLKSIASAVFFSAVIVTCMTAITMTVFWDDFYRYSQSESAGISALRAIAEYLFGNWFGTSFYLLSWMILYIGITSRRMSKQMEIDNLRLQNSLKEAELSSLSNQLNPHFLFNALNNIRFMIHEDASNAEKMLMSLSSVLRYSLDSSKNVTVPLRDELEISLRYVELIQIQFEERLRFAVDIPEPLLNCQLPPMVLQMLLENAVKHGIENIREGGMISVEAKLENKHLSIYVCNDLPKHYKKQKRHADDTGIGLFNIGQRLELLYAEHGTIETDIIDNRFCVTVTIPQE